MTVAAWLPNAFDAEFVAKMQAEMAMYTCEQCGLVRIDADEVPS